MSKDRNTAKIFKTNDKDTVRLTPSQIAWVIKDVEKSKTFFQDMFGVKNFMPTGTTRVAKNDILGSFKNYLDNSSWTFEDEVYTSLINNEDAYFN